MTKDERIAELEMRIKELSEEHFEMFGDMKNYKNLWLAEQRKNKHLRHEICEKIRERGDKIYAEGSYYVNAYRISSELLDQIEGEK